jgi:hypothetical protein
MLNINGKVAVTTAMIVGGLTVGASPASAASEHCKITLNGATAHYSCSSDTNRRLHASIWCTTDHFWFLDYYDTYEERNS